MSAFANTVSEFLEAELPLALANKNVTLIS